MKKIKSYISFLNESSFSDKKFNINIDNIDEYRFELFSGGDLVSWVYFSIDGPNEFFNNKYISLFKLETGERYRKMGFMKYLLSRIFGYVKDEFRINNILLNVYKDNRNALDLYLSSGFEVYKDYDDGDESYFTLIKRL